MSRRQGQCQAQFQKQASTITALGQHEHCELMAHGIDETEGRPRHGFPNNAQANRFQDWVGMAADSAAFLHAFSFFYFYGI
jgi:hypothetical protein